MGFSTMSLTHIVIDFEYVQPATEDMSLIRGEDYQRLSDAEADEAMADGPVNSH